MERESQCTAGVWAGTATVENSIGVSQKVRRRTSLWTSNTLLGRHPKRASHYRSSMRSLHVHFLGDYSDSKTYGNNLSEWYIYIHWNIDQLSWRKKSAIGDNIDGWHWVKQIREKQILYKSDLYVKLKEQNQQTHEIENRGGWLPSSGGLGREGGVGQGHRFSALGWIKFWGSGVWHGDYSE